MADLIDLCQVHACERVPHFYFMHSCTHAAAAQNAVELVLHMASALTGCLVCSAPFSAMSTRTNAAAAAAEMAMHMF
jgi:hypothetical protein